MTGSDPLESKLDEVVRQYEDINTQLATPEVLADQDALRRLGRVRIATKYPRVATRHFAETGRQAEIVEVKGSVELAPLTGLVDGIVDLTATGRTLEENGLRVVEEIGVLRAFSSPRASLITRVSLASPSGVEVPCALM